MSNISIDMMAIALATAVACVVPGVFLVLRGVALMSDAISHSALLGIVLIFMIVQSLHSPLLILGAALAGVGTVISVELLIATQCLKKDAAIGLVFPLFFSIAVILISIYTRNVHLDMDMVLLGELAFAPFYRLIIGSVDYGPRSLWVMSILSAVSIILAFFFSKELKYSIFDYTQAQVTGLKPDLFYYALMFIASLTIVCAFDVVGSVVVVALMITPAATASFFASTVESMMIIAIHCAGIAALGGYWFAWMIDVSIAGSIALMNGLLFIIAHICFSENGFVAQRRKKCFIEESLIIDTICIFLCNQLPGCSFFKEELLLKRLALTKHLFLRARDLAVQRGLITVHSGQITLTIEGYKWAMHMQIH